MDVALAKSKLERLQVVHVVADRTSVKMVLIDRKSNEEQLLLETFFSKMHIERDICKKVISMGLKPQ